MGRGERPGEGDGRARWLWVSGKGRGCRGRGFGKRRLAQGHGEGWMGCGGGSGGQREGWLRGTEGDVLGGGRGKGSCREESGIIYLCLCDCLVVDAYVLQIHWYGRRCTQAEIRKHARTHMHNHGHEHTGT